MLLELLPLPFDVHGFDLVDLWRWVERGEGTLYK